MLQSNRVRIALAVVAALVVVFLVRRASGEVPSPPGGEATGQSSGDGSSGYRLASTWCSDCHAIERSAVTIGKPAPNFAAIANLPSTTELSLKVFLQTSHKSMPNFIIKPNDANDLVAYILSLKGN
jgi:mono/diheme cytochrome c family protein